MRQVTIEVYAFDGARWMLQQTFPERQKDQALEHAHQTYAQPHIKGVRVMQEIHDTDTGESTEKSLLKRTKSDDVPKSLAKEIKVKPAAPPPKASAKAAAKKAYPVASKAVPGAPGAAPAPRAAAAPTIRRSRGKNFKRMAGGAAGAVAGGAVLAAGGGLLVSQMPADAHLVMGLRGALGPNFVLICSAAILGIAVLTSAFVLFAALTEKDLLQTALPVRAAGPVTVTFPKIEVVEDDDTDIIEIKSKPPPDKTGSPDSGAEKASDTAQTAEPPPDDNAFNVDAAAVVGFFHKALSSLSREAGYMKGGRLDAYNWFG